MSKEFKAGIAVVTMLVAVFCGVLYKRVTKLKNTPAVAAAKKDSKPSDKAKSTSLFSSPSKLTASESDNRDVESSAASDRYKRPTQPKTDNTAAATEAPSPRASFLPAEEGPAADNRYAARTTPAAESSPPIEQAPPSESEPTEAPLATANPFRQPTTNTEPVSISPPESPAESPSVDTTADASPSPPPASIAIAVPQEAESSPPPAKFDEDAPAAVAAVAPRKLDHDIYEQQEAVKEKPASAPVEVAAPSRPASRFITPDEDSPQVTATPRSYNRAAEPPTSSIRASAFTPDRSDAISSGRYKVGPNENFWTIAERLYGSGSYFKALHAYNRQKFPVGDELAVGDEIATPPASDLERQFPQLCPKAGRKPTTQRSYAQQASAKLQADGKTYVVQDGDTLFDIARYELGKASRWAELYELNRATIGDDIDFLHPGMELILPEGAGKRDSITRQPGSSLR